MKQMEMIRLKFVKVKFACLDLEDCTSTQTFEITEKCTYHLGFKTDRTQEFNFAVYKKLCPDGGPVNTNSKFEIDFLVSYSDPNVKSPFPKMKQKQCLKCHVHTYF